MSSIRDGELLGDFPQAFSHTGLVNPTWQFLKANGRRNRPEHLLDLSGIFGSDPFRVWRPHAQRHP
jgi:hypothetical protein